MTYKICLLGYTFAFGNNLYAMCLVTTFFKNASTFYYEALPVQVAYCSTQGSRQFQQDTLLINNQVRSEIGGPDKVLIATKNLLVYDTMLFGVFDGHGGSDEVMFNDNSGKTVPNNNGFLVSQYVAKKIKNSLPNCRSDQNSIEQCFENINQDLLKEKIATNAGTTACIVQLRNDHNHKIYNVGDSRALSIDSKTENFNFTNDHSVSNQQERDRVNAIKGCTNTGNHFQFQTTKEGVHQVAVSRGFGDNHVSSNKSNGFMIVTPDIKETSCTMFFIGCDGCFDYTQNDDIATIYRNLLNQKKSLDEIAWYILYYITYTGCPDVNKPKFTLEGISLKKAQNFVRQHSKEYLHDNTSFVLLNIQENQGLYFNAINKERAILLFFAFLGISCKYFLYK